MFSNWNPIIIAFVKSFEKKKPEKGGKQCFQFLTDQYERTLDTICSFLKNKPDKNNHAYSLLFSPFVYSVGGA